MKKIFKIYGRDLKKIFTNSMAIILAVGIAVIPSLYAWFNIFANWDPYGSTGNMQVAVIIEDEGYTFKEIEINVGKEIKSNLEANDLIDWQFVSKEEAINGIKAGEYYAGIEIPKGFSKSLTSIVTDDFKQPEIKYYANEKKNAIATKITDKVVQTIQQEVNESFVTTVINVVGSLIDFVADASKTDALDTFDDLGSKLRKAGTSIAGVKKTVDSLGAVIDATQELGDAIDGKNVNKLIDSSGNLVESGEDLAKLLQTGVNNLTGSVDTALSEVTAELNSTAEKIENATAKTDEEIVKVLNESDAKVLKLKFQLETVLGALKSVQNFLPIKLTALNKMIDKTQGRIDKLNKLDALISKVATGSPVKNDIDTITNEMKNLTVDIDDLKAGYKKDVKPTVDKNLNAIIDTLRVTGDLIADISGDLPLIQSLAKSLDATTDSSADLVDALNNLLTTIQNELYGLADKIEGLGDSELLNTIKNMMSANSEQLGEFIACPVKLNTEKIYGIENYGSAMAPFYSTLAIWVGSMILIAVMKTKVKRKNEIGDKVRMHHIYFGRMLTFLTFAVAQSLIILLGDLYFLKIQCYHPFMFLLAGVFAALVFSMFIYSLTFALGDIGKSVGIILLVVQIGGSGGTFPIDVCPPFFQAIHPYLPFTFVINAMRECVCGTYAGDYWLDLLKLSAYIAGALVIGLGLKFLVKKPIRFFEKQTEKTDLF
ncbi:MAG: YhgE/Pip domain-containing protein [Eubacterium sp.]|nr:YhgE/Pip domain-containing protein [Eubacterium sp.]